MPKPKATASNSAAADREAAKKKAPGRAARAKKPVVTAKVKKAPAAVKRAATATKAARPRATAVKKPAATKVVRAKKPVVVKVKKSAATAKAAVGAEAGPKVTRRKACVATAPMETGTTGTGLVFMPTAVRMGRAEVAVRPAAPEQVAAKPQAPKPLGTGAASVKTVTRPTESIGEARECLVPVPKQRTEGVTKVGRRTGTRPAETSTAPIAAIDTALAARVAASIVANHLAPPRAADPAPVAASHGPTSDTPPANSILGRRETSTFRRMKERLANPPSHQLDSVLGIFARKKTHLRVTGGGFVPGQSIDKNYGIEIRPVNPLRRKAG